MRFVNRKLLTGCLCAASMAISGCGSGQRLSPTIAAAATETRTSIPTTAQMPTRTPAPTRTPKPTLTPTPTRTPRPTHTQTLTPTATTFRIAAALEEAEVLKKTGHFEEAILKYDAILANSADISMRSSAFAALEEIGAINLDQVNVEDFLAQDSYHDNYDDNVKACELLRLAHAAYAPVLKVQDRPSSGQDRQLYINAANIQVALTSCVLEVSNGERSLTDIIHSLLDHLALSPEEPAVMKILVPEILRIFILEAQGFYSASDQEAMADGELIQTEVGDYRVKGKKVSDAVDFALAVIKICADTAPYPSAGDSLGSSKTKRVLSCEPTFMSYVIERAGLSTEDLREIWYILKDKRVESSDLVCTSSYRGASGSVPFTYTYSGQWEDIYYLEDVHSGEVFATKTFPSTPPRCVFSQCYLNTKTNAVRCTGGESESTIDGEELIEWLKATVK